MKIRKTFELSINDARKSLKDFFLNLYTNDRQALSKIVNNGFTGIDSCTDDEVIQLFSDYSLADFISEKLKMEEGDLVVIRKQHYNDEFDLVDVSSTVDELRK